MQLIILLFACLIDAKSNFNQTINYASHFKAKPEEKYCYALALSGGGSHGCYETGVIWGLLHYGDPDNYRWDVISGVSAGSIQAGLMSVWPKGEELPMIDTISYLATITTNANITAHWPGHLPSLVEGLLHHKGLMDESPLLSYLDSYFANFTEIRRRLTVSAVNVETGQYKTFNESVGLGNLSTVIKASSSVPFVFEPTYFNGSLYMDGGTTWNLNLKDAVDRCLELVPDEKHVVLDIVITEAVKLSHWDKSRTTIPNYMRKRQIQKYYKVMHDVTEFVRARPDVNYRHFFKPDDRLSGELSELKFDNSTTWKFQMVGRDDARKAIEDNREVPVHSFESVLHLV